MKICNDGFRSGLLKLEAHTVISEGAKIRDSDFPPLNRIELIFLAGQ